MAKAKASGPKALRVRITKGEAPTPNGGGVLGEEGEVARRTETAPGSGKYVVEVSITSEKRRGLYVTCQPGEYEEL